MNQVQDKTTPVKEISHECDYEFPTHVAKDNQRVFVRYVCTDETCEGEFWVGLKAHEVYD